MKQKSFPKTYFLLFNKTSLKLSYIHYMQCFHSYPFFTVSAINSRPVCTGSGHFTPISKKAYSGYSRVRFESPQVPATREQLDEQLDEYMSKSKSHLDAELDAYMAQVDLNHIVWGLCMRVPLHMLHCIFFSPNGACNLTCRWTAQLQCDLFLLIDSIRPELTVYSCCIPLSSAASKPWTSHLLL